MEHQRPGEVAGRSVTHRIAIIGGGVSGLTTATLLQASGYDTALFALELPTATASQRRGLPQFASLHAMASILPHSVHSPKTARWTKIAQEYFDLLARTAESGVREQPHYEVFEEPPDEIPEYSRFLRDIQHLTEYDSFISGIPRRSDHTPVYGWRFRVLFCEAPTYLTFLYRVYKALGGQLVPRDRLPGQQTLVDYLGLD
jgi:D-amino-acid oxidase